MNTRLPPTSAAATSAAAAPAWRLATTTLLLLFFPHLPVLADEPSRPWTSSEGKVIEASLVAIKDEQIILKTGRGNFEFPLSRLSENDQQYIQQWQAKAREGAKAKDPDSPGTGNSPGRIGDFDNLKLGQWPNSVAAEFDIDQIQIVSEDKSGQYIYRSPHFEFRSNVRLSKSVVREFSRIFEATYELLNAIPVGLNAQPAGEGYYITKLYETQEQYFLDGGIPGSGGMFTYREGAGMIKIPLPNLGVKNTGTRFVVDTSKSSATLIHEITHQVMMRWAPLMPVWMMEGFAEVASSQIYNNGRFRMTDTDRAIKDVVTQGNSSGRDFSMINIKDLMGISNQQWAMALADGNALLNYHSANLLLYYFLRIDGDGKGEKLVNYLKALAEGMDAEEASTKILLAGRSYEDLQKDVAAGWRSEGLKLSFK